MEIKIKIDPKCHDPVILICTAQKTQVVENIIQAIEACTDSDYPLITGYRNTAVELISQSDIIRVHVEARKIKICTDNGIFESRKNLSYIETLLNKERFVRISRFEIVNIRRITRFGFSIAGTVQILLDDGTLTWAARRYVRVIHQAINRFEKQEE